MTSAEAGHFYAVRRSGGKITECVSRRRMSVAVKRTVSSIAIIKEQIRGRKIHVPTYMEENMDQKNEIQRHLQALCEEIGPRPTGSQANRDAVSYARRQFEAYGLTTQLQEFDCMDWSRNGGTLKAEGKEIPVMPAPYSKGCGVQGEIIRAGSLEELRKAPLSGKIVLLCDGLASEPFMPKSFVFWNPDEHKEIISLLENGGALAVLTVSLSAGQYLPIIEDGAFELPCGIVLPENLPLLDSGIRAVLKLDAERKAAKGANVIASYGSGAHKVCFSAHIDTGNMTPGALDNASGTAVLLAMASQLQGKTYPYRLEFVLFNGEDYYSTPGEMAYLASHLSRPEDYVCAFNVDGAGLKGKDITYSFYECPEKLSSSIRSFASRLEGFSETEPWPQGDHTLFSFSGVPAVAITSSGIFELTEKVLHTEKDIPALVDTKKLGELAAFLLGAV